MRYILITLLVAFLAGAAVVESLVRHYSFLVSLILVKMGLSAKTLSEDYTHEILCRLC